MDDATVLEKIIDDAEPPPIPKPVWTDAKEERFKSILGQIKCEAKIIGRTLFIRPANVMEFGARLKGEPAFIGCEIARDIVQWLGESKERHIRFRH